MPKATIGVATSIDSTSPDANGRAPTREVATSMTPPSAPSLRDLVRERLEASDDPNPHAVVDDVLADLDDAQYKEAARKGLAELAMEVVRSINSHNLRTRSNTSPKWSNAKRAAHEYPEIFLRRICIGHDEHGNGIWRYLGDCSAEDLKGAEDYKRSQAEGLVSGADRLARLRKQLKRNQTVRDLAAEKVEEILNA
jgi:hypothetical protein